MENKASITALMSAFGRAWHTEHEENPIFADHKAKALLTDEEYKIRICHRSPIGQPRLLDLKMLRA